MKQRMNMWKEPQVQCEAYWWIYGPCQSAWHHKLFKIPGNFNSKSFGLSENVLLLVHQTQNLLYFVAISVLNPTCNLLIHNNLKNTQNNVS